MTEYISDIMKYETKCPFCGSLYDMFTADERSRCANCGKDLIDAIEYVLDINRGLLKAGEYAVEQLGQIVGLIPLISAMGKAKEIK